MRAPTTIRVVEDDPDVRESLCDALSNQGYEPVAACDGAEALDILRTGKSRPCLLLLDLMMPIMDGWRFRAEQLRDPAMAKIPVVGVSADGNALRHAALLEAAAGSQKPFELPALMEIVDRLCA